MKRICFYPLVLIGILILSACEKAEHKFGPADVRDTETDVVYSLGMRKSTFDNAFDDDETQEEEDFQGNTVVSYLGGDLDVTFEHGSAIDISCPSDTDRFSFYNFDFSMTMEQIEENYRELQFEELKGKGYKFFDRYYDENGEDVTLEDAYIRSTLMVADGNLYGIKDGQYISYSISYLG